VNRHGVGLKLHGVLLPEAAWDEISFSVVVVLVAVLVFSLPWGMPHSEPRPKTKRPN
jgi:hypothetical protein